MSLDHPTVRRVADALQAGGASGAPIVLDDPPPTAATGAAQLVFEVPLVAGHGFAQRAFQIRVAHAGNLCAVLRQRALMKRDLVQDEVRIGAHRVDTVLVSGLVGAQHLGRADADFVRKHTGMAIGGVAPIGHPRPIRTLVDIALARYDVVWAAGGHPHTVFPTTYDELLRITAGTPAEVG